MRVAAGLPPPPAANGVINHDQYLSLKQIPAALIKFAEADAADALVVGQNRGRVRLWRVGLAALGQALGALAPAAADAPQEAWGGGRGGRSQGQQQPKRPALFPTPRAKRKAQDGPHCLVEKGLLAGSKYTQPGSSQNAW